MLKSHVAKMERSIDDITTFDVVDAAFHAEIAIIAGNDVIANSLQIRQMRESKCGIYGTIKPEILKIANVC